MLYGYTARTNDYDNDKRAKDMRRRHLSRSLPRFVALAFRDGYTLASRGVLCWAPIPRKGIIPRARVRFVAVEAVFTAIFYAAFKTTYDTAWTDFVPFDIDDVKWDPLCSHSPLMEGVLGDMELGEAQLEEIHRLRLARQKQNSIAFEKRERAKDLTGWLKKKAAQKYISAANNKVNVKISHDKTVAKIKSNKKHACDPCNQVFASSRAIKNHLTSKKHFNKVNGVRKAPTANALRGRKHARKAKANKKHFCALCNHSATGPARLAIHQTTKKHLAKVAALAKAI